jgi:hypothetical protein
VARAGRRKSKPGRFARLADVRKELQELRMANWKKVGIADHPPKKAAS